MCMCVCVPECVDDCSIHAGAPRARRGHQIFRTEAEFTRSLFVSEPFSQYSLCKAMGMKVTSTFCYLFKFLSALKFCWGPSPTWLHLFQNILFFEIFIFFLISFFLFSFLSPFFLFVSIGHLYTGKLLIFVCWLCILYSTEIIRSKSFLVESLGSVMFRIMSYANMDNLISPFSFGILYISFSCFIVMDKISSTILNKGGDFQDLNHRGI